MMRRAGGAAVFIAFVASCASSSEPPQAPVTTASTNASQQQSQPQPQPPPATHTCGNGQVADPITHACIVACGAPPAAPTVTKDPTCEAYTLKDGKSFHDILQLQLGSGSGAALDCPRMRFRGQDTPICVVAKVGDRMRGACCPPGHTNPTDPECVAEGSPDEMFKRQKVWEWCKKGGALPTRACEPCVWVTGAERQ